MNSSKWLALMIGIGLAAVFYILFLTQGVPLLIEAEFPFGLSDRFQNYKSTAEIISRMTKFIPSDLGYYDRPVRVLLFRMAYPFLGLNPFGYYLIRAILAASIVLLIINLLKGKGWMSICAGLFYLFAPPTFLQIKDLPDIALVVEFLIFSCFYIFLRIYNDDNLKKNRIIFYSLQILIIFLSLIANGAKGNARIIPLVLLFFVIFDNRRKLLSFLPLILLLFLNISPLDHFLRGPKGLQQLAAELPYGIDFSKIYQVVVFNTTHNTFFGNSLMGVAGILNILLIAGVMVYFFRKGLSERFPLIFAQHKSSKQDRTLAIFAGVWLFWTIAISILYSYVEPQRLINSLVPAAILIFLFLYYLMNLFKKRFKFIVGIFIFASVILTEGIDLGKTLVIRCRNTSYLIAQNNINYFIEKVESARNSLVLVFGGGTRLTQANADTTNTYSLTLETDPAKITLNDSAENNRKYENIYIVSGYGPVKNAERKGLEYLIYIDGSTISFYDRIRKLLSIPASYPFYIYKYTGGVFAKVSENKFAQGQQEELANLIDFDFSGDYIYADYDFWYSGTLSLKKIDGQYADVEISNDTSWGEVVKRRSKIIKNRVRVEISKVDIIEIVFKKDKSFIGYWKEGNMEQKQGKIFGRLKDDG